MTEKQDKETLKNIRKMKPIERKALQILARNPEMTNYAIGKYLVQLGHTTDIGYVSKRLKASELLTLELSKIRENHAEVFSRRIVPKALDLHEEALKEKIAKDVVCTTRDKIVKVSTCKRCEGRKACQEYIAYQKERRELQASQFKYVKLAEEVEFKTDEKKRSVQIGTINVETLKLVQNNQLIACQDKLKQFEEEEVIDV